MLGEIDEFDGENSLILSRETLADGIAGRYSVTESDIDADAKRVGRLGY